MIKLGLGIDDDELPSGSGTETEDKQEDDVPQLEGDEDASRMEEVD